MAQFYTTIQEKKVNLPFSINPLTYNEENSGKTNTVETVKLKLEDIKKPICPCKKKIDNTEAEKKIVLDFSFEKQRLEIIGHEKLAQFGEDGPKAEVNLQDPQVEYIRSEQKRLFENEKDEIEKWGIGLRALVIISSTLEVISSILSMLYIFLMAVYFDSNIIKTTVPIGFGNIAANAWMVFISIKGSGASKAINSRSDNIRNFLRFCIGSIIVFAIQLILMCIFESIPDLIKSVNSMTSSSKDNSDNGAVAFVALGYLILWGFCIINLTFIGLAMTFTFFLKKHLRSKEWLELKQNTLPLGYQIFTQMQENQGKPIAIPYKI